MSRIITLTFSFCMLILATSVAQLRTPSASPGASFTQDLGLIKVTGEYSRPGVKGRVIFADNGLVPFGKVWRTGANSVTQISFSGDVMVEDKDLKEGSYAILSIPGASSWKVHFYAYEGSNWSSYVEKEPAAIVTVQPQSLPFSVENFFITVANLTDNEGTLELIWDKTLVPVKITTEVDKAVMAQIDRMLSGPSNDDYYAAGNYYFNSGKDANKALEFIQKATKADNPKFWQLRMEAVVLAKLGKYKEAIAVAQKSKELAQAAGNEDYVKINSDNIAMWSKM